MDRGGEVREWYGMYDMACERWVSGECVRGEGDGRFLRRL
jgi:hypothetical protein